MCTLILLFRPGHAWPVLLAANRDEMLARPWRVPDAHWTGQPGVAGGLDLLGGGTWLAVNAAGVIAGVLNRAGTLGPLAGRRSRGELPLMALRHPTARAASAALAALDGGAYRSFNLVVADRLGAFFVCGLGQGAVQARALPPGLHMVTASDPNDLDHPRVARHLPRFAAAPAPEPPDWAGWEALLADEGGGQEAALNVPPRQGFGTSSATLIGLGAAGARRLRFAPGPPGRVAFGDVAWPASSG